MTDIMLTARNELMNKFLFLRISKSSGVES